MGEGRATSPAAETVVCRDDRKGIYRKFALQDNRIIGAILLDSVSDAGTVLNLIAKRVDVSDFRDQLATTRLAWGKVLNYLL